MAESRSVLDTEPSSFELVESRRGFSVLARPVQGGKGVSARCNCFLLLPAAATAPCCCHCCPLPGAL